MLKNTKNKKAIRFGMREIGGIKIGDFDKLRFSPAWDQGAVKRWASRPREECYINSELKYEKTYQQRSI